MVEITVKTDNDGKITKLFSSDPEGEKWTGLFAHFIEALEEMGFVIPDEAKERLTKEKETLNRHQRILLKSGGFLC